MKIQYAPPQIFRLDIDYNAISNKVPVNPTTYELRYEFGVDNVPDKHIWISLRISLSISNAETGDEVVGYLFGYRGIAFLEGIDKDSADVKLFVQNAFLNFQFCFEQNTPKNLFAVNLIQNPNEAEYARNLMSHLVDSGVCYPE